jgi:hypothetical protein
MRDFIFDLVDLLEILFLEPFRYLDEIKEIPFARRKISNWIFSIISALSVSAGMSLLSPPYTIGTIGFLFFGFIANLIIMRFFPFFICVILDFYAQGKGRDAKVTFLLQFSRHTILVFAIFAPISLILISSGIYGRGIGILLLIAHFLLYGYMLGRGVKYIYDLKNRDAFRFAYLALFFTFIFPLLFNIYTASSILQSISGGF